MVDPNPDGVHVRRSLHQGLRRVERRGSEGGGGWAVTLLGVFAGSWVLGWVGVRPPEVNRAVKALRALIAHRRLTGLLVGLGFLAFLYFCRFSKWAKDLQWESCAPELLW